MNFDSLRSIAFEINLGEKFENVIKDLNIVNIDDEKYSLALHFKNGDILKSNTFPMNLFGNNDEQVWLRDNKGEWITRVCFNTSDCIYDSDILKTVIPKDAYSFDFDESTTLKKDDFKKKVDFLAVTKCRSNGIHYAV